MNIRFCVAIAALFCASATAAYNTNDRCGCDPALNSALFTESERSNDQTAVGASSFLLFCDSTFEESKDTIHGDSAGQYAVEIFKGNVNYTREQYEQKRRDTCTVQSMAYARQQVQSRLRTGPSVKPLQDALAAWTKCKLNCKAWGLSCVSSEPTRQGDKTCVRVNVKWESPYLSNRAMINAISISPGLQPSGVVLGELADGKHKVTGLPFLTVCSEALKSDGSVAISVLDKLGNSDARDQCDVGIPRAEKITFGAINANGYSTAGAQNVTLSDTDAKWFLQSIDADLPTRFFVPSSGAPDGINTARLMMNFASTVATRIRVGVTGDRASAESAQPAKVVDIPADPNPDNLPSPATRRNVALGEFFVRPGENFIVIATDKGSQLPLVNGFWFEY